MDMETFILTLFNVKEKASSEEEAAEAMAWLIEQMEAGQVTTDEVDQGA